VWGSITDSSKDSVTTDDLRHEDRIAFEGPSRRRELAYSPETGRYRIEGLEPGPWTISADIRGYHLWTGTIVLLREDLERRLDIVLEGYPRLQVRIEADLRSQEEDPKPTYQVTLDALMGWPEIRAVVTRDPLAESLPIVPRQDAEDTVARSVETQREDPTLGWFVEESVFEIHCPMPVHVSAAVGDRVLRTEPVESVARKVVFVLTRAEYEAALGNLRFRVLEESGGTPTAPVSCTLRREAFNSGIPLPPSITGEFTLRRLLPGPLGIEIMAPGYASARIEARVEAGMDQDLGDIRLRAGTAIRGRILSPDDSLMSFEAARIECIALSQARDPPIFGREPHRTTGTEGRFTITGLERGRYVLRTCGGLPSSLACGPIEVSTEAGSVDGVGLRLRSAAEVDIKLDDPRPEGCTIFVEDVANLPAADRLLGRDGYAVFTLPLGRYSARAVVGGQVVARAEFEVEMPHARVILEPR